MELKFDFVAAVTQDGKVVSKQDMALTLPNEVLEDGSIEAIINGLAENQESAGKIADQCAKAAMWIAARRYHHQERMRREAIENAKPPVAPE